MTKIRALIAEYHELAHPPRQLTEKEINRCRNITKQIFGIAPTIVPLVSHITQQQPDHLPIDTCISNSLQSPAVDREIFGVEMRKGWITE